MRSGRRVGSLGGRWIREGGLGKVDWGRWFEGRWFDGRIYGAGGLQDDALRMGSGAREVLRL